MAPVAPAALPDVELIESLAERGSVLACSSCARKTRLNSRSLVLRLRTLMYSGGSRWRGVKP